MNRLKLSVAMCTYNGVGFVREQLMSIASQTRSPDELIICDDHSGDGTLNVINAFVKDLPFAVHVRVNEKNLGVSKNFQQAIELCQGDMIAFSDQDDIWYPDKLELFEKAFLSSPSAGVVFCDAEVVDEYLKPLSERLWSFVRFSHVEQRQMNSKAFEVLLRHNVVTGAAMAFRSKYKHLVLPIPSNWIHDGWIALLVAGAADVNLISQPLIKYRQHTHNKIGVLQKMPPNLADKIYRKRKIYYDAWAQYKAVWERLMTQKDLFPVRLENLDLLSEKLAHLNYRAHLSSNIVKRAPLILREYFKGHYQRHSNGIQSVIKDIFFR